MVSRTALILASALACTAPSFAQRNPSPTQTPPAQPASSQIDLDVVVRPKSGPPVAGLQQQDFTVLDNKVPQHITSFHAVSGGVQTVHVLLVIDAVNAFYQTIAYERDQIDRLLHANGGHLAQPMALAFFTDTGIQVQRAFSNDGNELATAMDQYAVALRTIHRSSQWQANDRFQLSVNALQTLAAQQADLPGRKVVLWVSPGWPLLSGPGIELDAKQQNQIFATIVGLSNQLRQARVTLYAVDPLGASEGVGRTFYYQDFLKGVSKPGQVMLGDLSLQVLAVQSGGLALSSSNDVATLLQQCIADTEAYYELSFDTPAADRRDEYHSLEVKVAKPGLSARTRTGYYAQPDR
ncbi:MAG TPA: VWA domain-containing protein [Acidobacteriaceae bacterium]|nr:VWA domain-containing protein [Acidobacteriaceae bacterium]